MTGTVFDLKEFSIHDGPGARVTVFLKGCPLRCKWCHNPEGLSRAPQLLWKEKLCRNCGRCQEACDHADCREFGRCIHRCTSGALTVSGTNWEADDLVKKLRGYETMLASMGGGITVSGGEPLFQPDFTLELLRGLEGMHRAIQTSGYAPESTFRSVLQQVEYVMMDVKLADSARHREYTGVDNTGILRNLQILQANGKPHVLRVPLIPGITDLPENLQAIAELAGESAVELLEYNQFAPAKYRMLGKEFPLGEVQQPNPVDPGIFRHGILRRIS